MVSSVWDMDFWSRVSYWSWYAIALRPRRESECGIESVQQSHPTSAPTPLGSACKYTFPDGDLCWNLQRSSRSPVQCTTVHPNNKGVARKSDEWSLTSKTVKPWHPSRGQRPSEGSCKQQGNNFIVELDSSLTMSVPKLMWVQFFSCEVSDVLQNRWSDRVHFSSVQKSTARHWDSMTKT